MMSGTRGNDAPKPRPREDDTNELVHLAACALRSGSREHARLSGVRRGLLAHLNYGDRTVIYLTVVITVVMFIYLGVALVRPEWF